MILIISYFLIGLVVFFFLIKMIFKKVPLIIPYLPAILIGLIGMYFIGRFLYLTWTGVYDVCNIDPDCMNEDFSIAIGIIMVSISFVMLAVMAFARRTVKKSII